MFLPLPIVLCAALLFAGCEKAEEAADESTDAGNGASAGEALADSTGADSGGDTLDVSVDRILVETALARRGRISSTLPFSSTLETGWLVVSMEM